MTPEPNLSAVPSPAAAPPPAEGTEMLSVRTAQDSSTFLIALSGDLDLSNAVELEHVLGAAARSDVTETVVDLTHLQFIDSTGLRLLVLANRTTLATGRSFRLLRGSDRMQRVFDVCGLSETFTFAD